MTLTDPVIITPRLMPGVKIGDGFVSIEYGEMTQDGRQSYTYYIDPLGPEEGFSDLSSGVGGGSLQQGLRSLLSFMDDAAEHYRYWMGEGIGREEYEPRFTREIDEWCYQGEDEISILACEVEEGEELIKED